MSTVTWRDQEAVDDFIQYSGSTVNWDSETGFHTLMTYLEHMRLGIRIEDHGDAFGKWKVFLQDTEGALIGMGTCFDEKPWTALIKAVVQASINNPVGYDRIDGHS